MTWRLLGYVYALFQIVLPVQGWQAQTWAENARNSLLTSVGASLSQRLDGLHPLSSLGLLLVSRSVGFAAGLSRLTQQYPGRASVAVMTDTSIRKKDIQLPNGLSMEWLACGERSRSSPPVLFIHGTFHGAWCWSEHWMPYFARQGLECHAVSLRGTSGSPDVDGLKSIQIQQHVKDLQSFVSEALDGETPILVGHSFGGAYVLKYVEAGGSASGMALLCSVPPSGNGPMVMRFLRRSFGQAFLITKGFAFKTATKSTEDARALFFDERASEATVAEYLPRFQADSVIGLDVGDFSKNLPSAKVDETGQAAWLSRAPPSLVLGCEKDAVVDSAGIEEMGKFLGTQAEMLADMPHDLMLCEGWKSNADRVIEWVQTIQRKA